MLRPFFIVLIVLFANQCKAQKMTEITIKYDTAIEEKQLVDQIEYNEKFEKPFDDYILYVKNSKTPYTGILNILYKTGDKYATYSYKNGKQEGGQITYFKNGSVNTNNTIKNGTYEGNYLVYFENGNVKMNILYKSGEKRESKNYYENGQLMDEAVFNSKEIRGTIYYENGNIKSSYIFNETTKEGYYKNYFEHKANVLESEGKIVEKQKFTSHNDGLWKYYYENGVLKEEGSWAMGGRHGNDNIKIGVWKLYNEDGNLIERYEYNKLGSRIK